jgi:hypothetical protein
MLGVPLSVGKCFSDLGACLSSSARTAESFIYFFRGKKLYIVELRRGVWVVYHFFKWVCPKVNLFLLPKEILMGKILVGNTFRSMARILLHFFSDLFAPLSSRSGNLIGASSA